MSKNTASADLFDGGAAVKTPGASVGSAQGGEEYTVQQLRLAGQKALGSLVAPGQMSKDEAKRYYSLIKNLFPSVDNLEVEVGLFAWGCLQGTGSNTDYSQAEPLVLGGKTVAAVRFAGDIVPVDSRGLLRKFFSTYFEEKAQSFFNAIPTMREKMAARAAKAGDAGGDPFNHVDFIKGVSSSTKGSVAVRIRGKEMLLAKRSGTPVSGRIAQPEVTFGDSTGATNGLFG